MQDWLLYYNAHFPDQNTILSLGKSIFDNENLDELELEHRRKVIPQILTTTPVPATAPTPPHPTSSVPSSSFSFRTLDPSATNDEFEPTTPPQFSTPSTTPSVHTTSKELLSFRKLYPLTTNNEFEPTIGHSYNRPTIHFVQDTSYTSHMNTTHQHIHSPTQSEVKDTSCNSSTATTDSFRHDFYKNYEAACDNFRSPPQVANENIFSNYNTYGHNHQEVSDYEDVDYNHNYDEFA